MPIHWLRDAAQNSLVLSGYDNVSQFLLYDDINGFFVTQNFKSRVIEGRVNRARKVFHLLVHTPNF